MRRIIKWAGLGFGSLIICLGYIWEGYQLSPSILGWDIWQWQLAGAIIFFLAIAGLLEGYRREQEKVSTKAAPFDGTFKQRSATHVEFFSTIDELRARYPLSETFKPGNDIHAYFLSGEGVFAEHNDYIKRVKRLILPRPDAANIATLQTLSNSYVDFRTQINKTLALAEKNNIPARLFQDFTGVSLLFCNPDGADGWIHVGVIIPGSESAQRQHYRIERSRHEQAFLSLYKTFNTLWEASTVGPSADQATGNEYIPLKDAAERLYTEFRSKDHIMAYMAEKTSGRNMRSGSEEDILDMMAGYISRRIPVYGRRPPSRALEQIGSDAVKSSRFTEGATKLEDMYHKSTYFTDLVVKSAAFDELVADLQVEEGFQDTNS